MAVLNYNVISKRIRERKVKKIAFVFILIFLITFNQLIFDIKPQSAIKKNYSNFYDTLLPHPTQELNVYQQYAFHTPINISSDSDFASQGFNGSGTTDDPYLIEGFNITAGSSELITIKDTTVHFSIKNNFLNGLSIALKAIVLFNVTYGTIEHNFVLNHKSNAVSLHFSNHNVIVNNNVCDNAATGIKLDWCENNSITNNTIYNNSINGISVLVSNNNNILYNTIRNNLAMA